MLYNIRWGSIVFSIVATFTILLVSVFLYSHLPVSTLLAQTPSSMDTRLAKGVGVVLPTGVNFHLVVNHPLTLTKKIR